MKNDTWRNRGVIAWGKRGHGEEQMGAAITFDVTTFTFYILVFCCVQQPYSVPSVVVMCDYPTVGTVEDVGRAR